MGASPLNLDIISFNLLNKVISTWEPACLAGYILVRQTKFMPSGDAVEFDLICPKVREDDRGFQHLLHLRHGVNSLRGWRETALDRFGTNGTPEAFPLESDLLYGCS